MDKKETITLFAKTNFRNKEAAFGIKTDDRRRHMYLIGKTGMGKTTLMENMVIQDIQNGHGVCFIDPHGDSVQRILNSVPSSRVNDVIYFNPADLEFPIAFNILESVDSRYKHLVASGLMGVFTKIWANVWSARMEYILNNTILALLDTPGNTLLGITRMYVDKKYRKRIIDNIKDPIVKAFWNDEYANYNEKYRTEAIAPIQNKVGQFLSSSIIRNIVGQPKSTIDLREVMDSQKIIIVDISKGKVGEDSAALLGAMIITKIQLAALSMANIPESERKDFYLYVDEFQNFATDSFATILSEARKYRLNLIVGHQYIAQLEQDKNTKVRDAIFGNVGTMVIFRVGAADAEYLETEFDPIFTPNDLVNLPKYHIILKLMINGVASDPFSAITLSPNPADQTENMVKIVKVSRERYANPSALVEEKIARWMDSDYHKQAAILIGQHPDSELEDREDTEVFEKPANEATETAVSSPQPKENLPQLPRQEPALEEANKQTPPPKNETENFFGDKPDKVQPPKIPAPPKPLQSQRQERPQIFKPQQRQRFEQRKNEHKKDRNRPPQKAENPIWKTVQQVNVDKAKQQLQSLNSNFENFGENAGPQKPVSPAPAFKAPDKIILKPGQPHSPQNL